MSDGGTVGARDGEERAQGTKESAAGEVGRSSVIAHLQYAALNETVDGMQGLLRPVRRRR